jgi:hypothetical protein
MVAIEEGDWPLIVVRWQTPVCSCDLNLYRAAFERWLQLGEHFAMVSIADEQVRLPAGLLEQMAAWMQRRRFMITRRCAGLASVLPAPMSDAWTCSYRVAASAQLGCPAAAFADEAQAIGWAIERLRGVHVRTLEIETSAHRSLASLH